MTVSHTASRSTNVRKLRRHFKALQQNTLLLTPSGDDNHTYLPVACVIRLSEIDTN